jgi:predicted kinase
LLDRLRRVEDNRAVALPLLVVVSGPPGSGTTTVAAALARAIPCPAVSRDEIKEGLVHAEGDYTPAPGDVMSSRAFEAFFGVLRFLVDAGASAVAEASFQHGLWEQGLSPLLDGARVRIVHCRVDARVARERIAGRLDDTPSRPTVHGDYSLLKPFESFKQAHDSFDPVALPVPSIEVDTTDGYDPSLEEIVAFLNRPDLGARAAGV